MQKIILFLLAASLSMPAMAQRFRLNKIKMPFKKEATAPAPNNYVAFNHGKLWIVKDAKTFPANEMVVMRNGTIVSPEGIVQLQSKKFTCLRNGERMDMDGNIVKVNPTTDQAPVTDEYAINEDDFYYDRLNGIDDDFEPTLADY